MKPQSLQLIPIGCSTGQGNYSEPDPFHVENSSMPACLKECISAATRLNQKHATLTYNQLIVHIATPLFEELATRIAASLFKGRSYYAVSQKTIQCLVLKLQQTPRRDPVNTSAWGMRAETLSLDEGIRAFVSTEIEGLSTLKFKQFGWLLVELFRELRSVYFGHHKHGKEGSSSLFPELYYRYNEQPAIPVDDLKIKVLCPSVDASDEQEGSSDVASAPSRDAFMSLITSRYPHYHAYPAGGVLQILSYSSVAREHPTQALAVEYEVGKQLAAMVASSIRMQKEYDASRNLSAQREIIVIGTGTDQQSGQAAPLSPPSVLWSEYYSTLATATHPKALDTYNASSSSPSRNSFSFVSGNEISINANGSPTSSGSDRPFFGPPLPIEMDPVLTPAGHYTPATSLLDSATTAASMNHQHQPPSLSLFSLEPSSKLMTLSAAKPHGMSSRKLFDFIEYRAGVAFSVVSTIAEAAAKVSQLTEKEMSFRGPKQAIVQPAVSPFVSCRWLSTEELDICANLKTTHLTNNLVLAQQQPQLQPQQALPTIPQARAISLPHNHSMNHSFPSPAQANDTQAPSASNRVTDVSLNLDSKPDILQFDGSGPVSPEHDKGIFRSSARHLPQQIYQKSHYYEPAQTRGLRTEQADDFLMQHGHIIAIASPSRPIESIAPSTVGAAPKRTLLNFSAQSPKAENKK
eukprot:GDKJ01037606.1.p1 GENE.GDKJ01037606.1~~GDKJ01037606.1.p1  ORF type:complete len:803 (-),score=28.47 GDKJ01037606.1:38-2110(-)